MVLADMMATGCAWPINLSLRDLLAELIISSSSWALCCRERKDTPDWAPYR
jgi:hypothetical protein